MPKIVKKKSQSLQRIIDIQLNPLLDQPHNQVITSKYTLLNFIPKNLFEQFRRVANFYFLCIALIQVTTNSPVSPATSLVPLIFVIATTALKQGYEDFLRHRSDAKANNFKVPVFKDSVWSMTKCSNISNGCIVQVENNGNIPCDMILLHSSSNGAWVTTTSLDGETTLKYKESLSITQSQSVEEYRGQIKCEPPNADLYEYTGVYTVDDNNYPLSANNLLLRGSRLENTSYIFGFAVFTGPETKMSLNSKLTSNKFSSVEQAVNRYLLFYFAILFVISFLATSFHVYYRNDPVIGEPPYVDQQNHVMSTLIASQFLNFFVIFNYLIPISLYVSLEMVKFFGSKQLVNDPLLIYRKPNGFRRPICNSSDLNEELGQVEYLFSDKTGTLTENVMRLKGSIYNGVYYENERMNNIGSELFVAMCLCCSVTLNSKDETLSFICESPDEKALIEGASKFNVVLIKLEEGKVVLSVKGVEHSWFKLRTLDFDTYRKRMSVIIKDEEGNITLICKGADSSLFPLLKSGPIEDTYQNIDTCANNGLRILVFGKKSLTEAEYIAIEDKYKSAIASFNRKEKLAALYKYAEKDLHLIGVTAVEDRLQEGVVETIKDLKTAGIKIWILTGDKLETAVSVAYSCNLLDETMTQLILSRQSSKEICGESLNRFADLMDHECLEETNLSDQEISEKDKKDKQKSRCKIARDFKAYMEKQSTNCLYKFYKDRLTPQLEPTIRIQSSRAKKSVSPQDSYLFCHSPKYALLLDGRSLYLSLMHYRSLLHKLCLRCDTVICSRLSPLQKAEVVSLMRGDGVSGAIGDGANDVSMLQQAGVGIGIAGNEGSQAVDSSDIGVGKFGDLRRVLFVHGSIFYVRVARLIHYFFYKNVAFVTPQIAFAFSSAFSAQTLYHGFLLMCYNMVFTALPIFIYGLKEKHIPEKILENNPQLYKKIRRNALMNIFRAINWFIGGVIDGCIAFFGFLHLSNQYENNNIVTHGLFAFGTMINHCVIFIVTLKLLIISNKWSKCYLLSIVASILTLFIVCYTYSMLNLKYLSGEMFGIYKVIITSTNFWLSLICTVIIAIIPDLCQKIYKNTILINKANLRF